MEDQTQLEKWEGKLSINLSSTNANQAWSLLSDFCSINLWFPGIHTCKKVGGVDSQPGCIRYVASPPGEDGKPVHWANEELVGFNPVERSISYKVTENNMGFGEYLAHFSVLPAPKDGSGCVLEWSFECEPVKGWSVEGVRSYLDSGLKVMAERVEATTTSNDNNMPEIIVGDKVEEIELI